MIGVYGVLRRVPVIASTGGLPGASDSLNGRHLTQIPLHLRPVSPYTQQRQYNSDFIIAGSIMCVFSTNRETAWYGAALIFCGIFSKG